jgi:hypothetical protein
MKIKFISNCVDGEIPLDELEIVCVPMEKYAEVQLCIKSNMNIPFAKIKLFDTDRWVDAEKSFEAATALGNKIAYEFNDRHKASEMSENLSKGRHYLMGVQPEDLTVEDALEAFGFGRNGLKS